MTSMALARTTNPIGPSRRETSQLDALLLMLLRVRPDFDEHLEHRIHEIAKQHPQYRYSPSAIRTRRARLVDVGLIVDSGDRAITEYGRPTTVWKAVQQ